MSGQASGGQKLTPYTNVNAPAGVGGDLWGANGGGITPMIGPRPVLANAANGVRDLTAVHDAKNNGVVKAGLSNTAIRTTTVDQVYADDGTSQVFTADMESPGVADSQL